jgi:hypothetical protein
MPYLRRSLMACLIPCTTFVRASSRLSQLATGLKSLGEPCNGASGEPSRLWMKQELGWDLELTIRTSKPGKPDFGVAPRRWVVERAIAWLCDFERLVVVSTGWVYAAMTLLMARRWARTS